MAMCQPPLDHQRNDKNLLLCGVQMGQMMKARGGLQSCSAAACQHARQASRAPRWDAPELCAPHSIALSPILGSCMASLSAELMPVPVSQNTRFMFHAAAACRMCAAADIRCLPCRLEELLDPEIVTTLKKMRLLQKKRDEMDAKRVLDKTRKYLAQVCCLSAQYLSHATSARPCVACWSCLAAARRLLPHASHPAVQLGST